MQLGALLDVLQSLVRDNPELLKRECVVRVENPSVGPSAVTVMNGVTVGFDWDKGRLILSTEDRLLSLSKASTGSGYEDAIVQEAHGTDDKGVAMKIVHGGEYIGPRIRTALAAGDRIRIVKLTPSRHWPFNRRSKFIG